MKPGIRWKLMAAYFAIGGLVLLFMILYLSFRLQSFFEQRMETRLQHETELARDYFGTFNWDAFTLQQADSLADRVAGILAMRVTLILPNGKVIGESEFESYELPAIENHANRPEVIEALAEGLGVNRRFSTTVNRELIYFAYLVGSPENPDGIVRLAVPVAEIDRVLSEINQLIWLSSAVGFVLVLIVGFLVSRPIIHRINDMADVARRFSQGDFSTKITSKSNDELGELGGALNQMANELKRNITAITKERDQLQAILNSMVEGVVVTDLTGRILLSNQSFKQIFQLSAPVENKSIREVLRDIDLIDALERAISETEDVIESMELAGRTRRTLEAHIAILRSHEQPSGAVIVFHDITTIKQLEKVRRDFVANVSHELRTPLTAIKGFAETLLDSEDISSDKAKDFLGTIHRHTDRMAKLVDDLLMLSKLESVEHEVQLEKIDLAQIINKVVYSFKRIKSYGDIGFIVDLPEHDLIVSGVFSEIETVLENLIENAVKYGGKGKSVTVSAKKVDGTVQVDVSDKGPGIPIDDQGRIFERFYRVDKGRSRELGGTGLGLAIVKHVVQRHGGRVWVESVVGQGATFSFTLKKHND